MNWWHWGWWSAWLPLLLWRWWWPSYVVIIIITITPLVSLSVCVAFFSRFYHNVLFWWFFELVIWFHEVNTHDKTPTRKAESTIKNNLIFHRCSQIYSSLFFCCCCCCRVEWCPNISTPNLRLSVSVYSSQCIKHFVHLFCNHFFSCTPCCNGSKNCEHFNELLMLEQ